MSLSELLVVIAVSAILASIAVPSYRVYLLRSHRVEATAALLQLSAAQEQFYLQNNTYTDELTTARRMAWDCRPSRRMASTTSRSTPPMPPAFQATARARGGQADDTHCAAFTIDQAGARTAKPRRAVTDCWSR